MSTNPLHEGPAVAEVRFLNDPDDKAHKAYYLRRPFHREPDFGVTSVNYTPG